MDSKKNLFKTDEAIVKYNSPSVWENMMNWFPSPEEEMENIKKERQVLKDNIEEIKLGILKLEEKLNETEDLEEIESLNNQKIHLETVLQDFKADLNVSSYQSKSLSFLLKEDDDGFETQLPELLIGTYISTKQKMEDVNSVVENIKKISKQNFIEECIHCEKILKDVMGRKLSVKHFHLTGYENFNVYKPVICEECLIFLKIEYPELKDINFKENISEEACKKGSKIFSCKIEGDIAIFKSKMSKIYQKEKEESIKSLKDEPEKSFLETFF